MDKDVVVFVSILAFVAAVVAGVVTKVISIPLLIIILLLGVIFFMLSSGVSTLEEYQRAVRFRFGKFDGVVGPGLVWSIPYVDTHIIVDMRTQTFDIKPQEVITKDNIKIKVDAIVYGRVIDPKKAIIEVKDYKQAIISLLYAEIREAIGKLELEELIGKTEELNDKLFETLNSVSKNWGVETQRVEVESIELPAGLTEAMTKRKEALEYKAKLETEATARQKTIEILKQATAGMSDTTLAYLYLDALKKISDGKSNKIIFPLELTRLASVLTNKLGGEEKRDYSLVIDELMTAYVEKQKKLLSEEPAQKEGKN